MTEILSPKIFTIHDTISWKDYLDSEGFVVIYDILDKETKQSYETQFKTDWNSISPNFDFENKDTWTIENTPMMFGKGCAVFKGMGNSNFMWNLRLDKNIQKIFKDLHSTSELVSSMDGCSVFVSKKQKSKSWLHIDQNSENPVYSIQGAYNFYPVGKEDAGFVVVPGSHRTFRPDSTKKDWLVVDQDKYISLAKKLIIPENCMVLWNSRVIHANMGIGRTKKVQSFNRLTAYIAFLPKSLRSETIRKKKIEAYKNSHTTSHWANQCHIKRYPWGFGSRFESRGFNHLKAHLIDDKIPLDRLNLL